MLLRILRWMRGYVRFTVCGRFPERFVNITSRRSIRLWDVERRDGTLSAAMYMADYRRIRALARSCDSRLKITGKYGLPTRMRRYRERGGVAVGAFIFLITVFVMSQFIWCVDVTGLDTISECGMRALLREHGLYVGACKIGMDYPGVSRAVMLDDRRVGWMAVNVTGSYASVEVKESSAAPEVEDIDAPCNVKVSRDGVIKRIDAGEGKILLKEGSGVVGGQLVVSGVMEDALGGVRLVHAEAHIIASVRDSVTFSVPDAATALLPDGEARDRVSLNLFGLRVPVSFASVGSECAVETEYGENPAPLGVALPIGVIRERVQGFSSYTITYDNNSAEEILLKRAQLFEVFSISGTVTARNTRLSHRDGAYILTADFVSEQDIAVQVPIGTDNSQ